MPSNDTESDFARLIRLVRGGDADAAAKLLQQFEPELRIIARAKLNDPQLRRLVDSMDICQSILGNFFFRASAGQFDIESPAQLQQLLAVMIRNKVTDHARRQKAVRRDVGRLLNHPVEDVPLANSGDTPSHMVAAKELASAAKKQFTPDELAIIERRIGGASWDEIASELELSPDAVRKQMKRATDRVAKSLGIDE